MIKVNAPNSINGIQLGMSKSEVELSNLEEQNLILEYKNDKVITISFRNEQTFNLNGRVLDVNHIKKFLDEENPFFDGEAYIFPNLNICIYGLNLDEVNYELTLYSSERKIIYEKGLKNLSKYKDINSKSIIAPASSLLFKPYESVGIYAFNFSEQRLKEEVGTPKAIGKGIRNKIIYDYDFLQIRFDEGKLTQVMLDYSDVSKRIPIFLGQKNITTIEGIKWLLKNFKYIERRNYYVWNELGLSINKIKGNEKPSLFYFFDRTLLPFWKNKFRPITSW